MTVSYCAMAIAMRFGVQLYTAPYLHLSVVARALHNWHRLACVDVVLAEIVPVEVTNALYYKQRHIHIQYTCP